MLQTSLGEERRSKRKVSCLRTFVTFFQSPCFNMTSILQEWREKILFHRQLNWKKHPVLISILDISLVMILLIKITCYHNSFLPWSCMANELKFSAVLLSLAKILHSWSYSFLKNKDCSAGSITSCSNTSWVSCFTYLKEVDPGNWPASVLTVTLTWHCAEAAEAQW